VSQSDIDRPSAGRGEVGQSGDGLTSAELAGWRAFGDVGVQQF